MDENVGKMTEIIDKRLGESYNIKSIAVVVKVAMRCIQAEPSSRPRMSEVVAELKEAIKREDSSECEGMVCSFQGLGWSDSSSNILKGGR